MGADPVGRHVTPMQRFAGSSGPVGSSTRGPARGRAVLRAARRVAAVAGALAVAVAPGAAALVGTLEVDWSEPVAGDSLAGQVALEAGVHLEGGLADPPVRELTLDLVDDGGSVAAHLCAEDWTGEVGSSTRHVELTWADSRSATSEPVACEGGERTPPDTAAAPLANSGYELVVTATDDLGSSYVERLPVTLDNPPFAPTGVGTEFDPDGQTLTVTWDANREPDLGGYLVERCRTDTTGEACAAGDWTDPREVGAEALSATYTVERAGAHRFRVAALRPASGGSQTLLSTFTAAPSPVVLEDDPGGTSTTTTTAPEPVTSSEPDGAVGDGDDGGPSGGDAAPVPGATGERSPDDDGDDGAGRERPRFVERSAAGPAGLGVEDGETGGSSPESARSAEDLVPAPSELGPGVAPVAIAGALFLLVLSLQVWYLGHGRAPAGGALTGADPGRGAPLGAAGPAAGVTRDGGGAAVTADAGRPPLRSGAGDPDAPVFRPLLPTRESGDFIRNWRRWLDDR